METFIVRIYRREKEETAGIVEVVGEGEKRSFADIEGLLGILRIGNRNVNPKVPHSPGAYRVEHWFSLCL